MPGQSAHVRTVRESIKPRLFDGLCEPHNCWNDLFEPTHTIRVLFIQLGPEAGMAPRCKSGHPSVQKTEIKLNVHASSRLTLRVCTNLEDFCLQAEMKVAAVQIFFAIDILSRQVGYLDFFSHNALKQTTVQPRLEQSNNSSAYFSV